MQPQLFNFNGQQVRTVVINNEPYFVGNDASKILGYSNYRKAVSNHVNDSDKLRAQLGYAGQTREVTVINEPGLYDLIIDASRQSKNPEVQENAQKFRDWITHEVLPAIRKHGAYMTDEKAYDITHDRSGAVLADLLQQAADQLKAKDVQIAEMKPKALFADAVSTAKTNILIGELAKILKANGVDHITVNGKQVTMGQNHFFQWLRENGYLIKRKGTDYNAPTQMAMNKKLFKVKESTSINADGTTRINKTTKVTGVGQQYFTNLFLAA